MMNVDNTQSIYLQKTCQTILLALTQQYGLFFDQKHYQNVFVLKLIRQHMVGRTLCVTSLLVQLR